VDRYLLTRTSCGHPDLLSSQLGRGLSRQSFHLEHHPTLLLWPAGCGLDCNKLKLGVDLAIANVTAVGTDTAQLDREW